MKSFHSLFRISIYGEHRFNLFRVGSMYSTRGIVTIYIYYTNIIHIRYNISDVLAFYVTFLS